MFGQVMEKMSLGGESGGIYGRRFYMPGQVWDCDTTGMSGEKEPAEAGIFSMPAVTAFKDGRFLLAWDTAFKAPDGSNKTRIKLRFLR